MARFQFSKYFDVEVPIDDQVLHLKIVRMRREEAQAFAKAYAHTERVGKRVNLSVKDFREDQDGIDDTYALARMDLANAEKAAKVEQLRDSSDEAQDKFVRQAFERYVVVPSGEISEREEHGVALLEELGGRVDIITMILAQIYAQNCLGGEAKKHLLSLCGFGPSSPGKSETPSGDGPATTADGASLKASASPEAAMAALTHSPSGMTVQ